MKSLTKILFTAALLCSTNIFASVQDRHLTGFNAIQVAGSFDVVITQGGTESVKVDAPNDVINRIITEVQNGTLKIYNKKESGGFSWNFSDKKTIIYVNAKNLNAIGITGSGDVSFKNGINAQALKINVTGSGNVLGKVNAKILDVGITGSGDVKLVGHADKSEVSVTGSGDYSGREVTTSSTDVRVSGSGNASIYATEKVNAYVAGSGDISYSGSPKQIATSKHGSGDIRRL